MVGNCPFIGVLGIGFFVDEIALEPIFGFALFIHFRYDFFFPVSTALSCPFHAFDRSDGCVDVIAHTPSPVEVESQVFA